MFYLFPCIAQIHKYSHNILAKNPHKTLINTNFPFPENKIAARVEQGNYILCAYMYSCNKKKPRIKQGHWGYNTNCLKLYNPFSFF